MIHDYKKLEALKVLGTSSYPSTSSRTHELQEVIRMFDSLESSQSVITLSGRVMSSRGQGALIFFDLYDGTAKFQAVINFQNQEKPLMPSI